MLYALQHGNPDDRARLTELYVKRDPDGDDVAELVRILDRSGAREYTPTEARRHRDAALTSSPACPSSTRPLATS